MRLIDADDFIEKNRELYDQAGWGRREVHFSLADLECNVDMMPSIDAVPVIRCKDCKHRYLENDIWVCPFGLPGGPEFFCGYGAKMEVEHD